MQADKTMHDRLAQAIQDDLVGSLTKHIDGYEPLCSGLARPYRIGDIEDANVLIQNSLWLNVPLGQLDEHDQVASLQDRRGWAGNQIEQIKLLRSKFGEMANSVIAHCV